MYLLPAHLLTPKPISPEEELARVNRQMYERNIELAVRNRTLSILRKMYEIINSTLGLEETAVKLIDSIIFELKFQKGFITLVDREKKVLNTLAVSDGYQALHLDAFQREIEKFSVSLREDDNYCVKAVLYKKRRMTNMLEDVFTPYIAEKEAHKIQENFHIKTSIIYPIVFAGQVLGTLMLGMDKHVGDLSRAERETLNEVIDVIAIAIERAQIYADLRAANEKLQELDKLKDEFVSLASHELRTPMAAIKSYLWMALSGRGGELTEKQKYYLERSYNSATRLIKLVNDMLNVSRIESGRITLEVKEIVMPTLIQEVIDELKPRADELQLQIEVVAKEVPTVLADPDKIKEVLVNLIGNSMKFTSWRGKITVSLEMIDGMIITRVKDTGVGLTQENVSKLFKKFSLIKDSYKTTKADTEGTGLGLYICKSIIELHEGKIWAESEGVGKGTTMSFSLKEYNSHAATLINKQDEGKEKIGIVHNEI